MPVIRISLNDMQYKNLTAAAAEEGISIQDYIRHQIFKDEAWFKPSDAVEMALTKYHPDELFTLPKVYGTDWMPKMASVDSTFAKHFGQSFQRYVLKYCIDTIKDIDEKADGVELYQVI